MKSIMTLAFVVMCSLATIASAGGLLPDGHFEGSGRWIGPEGSSGKYGVETLIELDVIKSTYSYPDAQPGRDAHTVRMSLLEDGTLEVAGEDGEVVGRGYCLEDECFYRMDIGEIVVEENVRFNDGRLVKFGSKSGTGFRIVWKEMLERR